MQCPSCHTENVPDARFCQSCGTALQPETAYTGSTQTGTAYAGVPGPTASGSAAYGQAPVMQGGLSDNAAAAIAYVTIIPAIIFLLVEPYRSRPFVRFHAVQCIGLTVASIVLRTLVVFLPFHTWGLYSLISLALFVVWLIAIVSAAQGKWFKLPVIGNIAEQQTRAVR